MPRGWLVNKVLWLVSRRYDGPVLIRGHEVGGRHRMLFDGNRSMSPQLRFSGRAQPSEVMVPTPGCYGWQIDGHGFSRVLIFRAVCRQADPHLSRPCSQYDRHRP